MRRSLVTTIVAGVLALSRARSASAQEAPRSVRAAPESGVTGEAPAQTHRAPTVVVVERNDEKKDLTRMLEDGGLGLEWVYLNADFGVAHSDLVSLKATNWALQDNSASGPAFGVGAGVRLVFLSAGVRVRDLQLSSFNLWETNAEAALHFRIWRVDGYVGARGGYAFLGSFSAEALRASTGSATSNVAVHGWNVGPTAGLDVYLSKLVSLGVDANAEALFLERPPLPLPPGQTVAAQYESLYLISGSSIGAGFVAMGHVGVHF